MLNAPKLEFYLPLLSYFCENAIFILSLKTPTHPILNFARINAAMMVLRLYVNNLYSIALTK